MKSTHSGGSSASGDWRGGLVDWFRVNARDLPWREPGTSAWGVLVSEVMSQQTPVARVAPVWRRWMGLWPGPEDLAAAPADLVLREWGKLGYPRRALRLRECAAVIVAEHGGRVPSDVGALLALPGVGDYTARAVAAFAFGARTPVVDVNVRRVLRRHRQGVFLPGPHRRADLDVVEGLLYDDPSAAAELSVAWMELGATVCRTSPACGECPVRGSCAWVAAGSPGPSEEELAAAKRRVQKFEGTDRQVRGKLLDVLRGSESPVERAVLDAVWPDAVQRSRALFSLLDDGLAVQEADGRFRLPR
ncbi:A/G-specific adenine glycosylase [Corynebacterium freneyi]|uniref:A/G-specific adenine glycosylase n=1 Tax=Corynebacterium freneyi TaxID=134034 RepID=UPI00068E3FFE|nr:A/G-specific adenine glycosylase [Corynebacterium freneyi]